MEQGQADQTGSYDPIYCYLSFCIHIPLKLSLDVIPSPGRFGSPCTTFSFSFPPPPSSSRSEAACRSCNTP